MGANLTYHERLGFGASGTVYRVTWKSKEFGTIDAAAKKIRFEGEISEKHKREIEFLKRLDHKNIIKYYDAVMEKEHVVIITEYAAKGSLDGYLKDRDKLPKTLLQQWIYHLACGVNYLEKNDVAHCDLKSPNCIIMADDVLKICDFGIAQDLTSTKTTRSAHKGSVKWQAPEIFKDEILSPKAAIYAFGIIVWEMVSCEEPYKGFRPERVIYQVMANSLRPKIPDDCPQFLRELMEQCWHQDRTQRPKSSEIVRRVWREYRPTPTCLNVTHELDNGLEWKLKHEIDSWGRTLHFVDSDRLAICRGDSVEVHHVSREETHLLYTLTSDEWRGIVWPFDVAVSESMPSSCILVICYEDPYVYQFPSHKASNYLKKYQVHVQPLCIVANVNTAVIGLYDRHALVVCSMPGFTQQKIVDLSFNPCDLTISTDYLVVMDHHEMVIKAMGDMGQDLCRIKPPDGWRFKAVSYRNDARHLYAACYNVGDRKGRVFKYTWDGNGTPKYHNTGCVIDDVGAVQYYNKGLSVTSEGVFQLALSGLPHIKIFSLE
ncbi:uncharacterized protein [Amphiura filiformis]|uniref:uncharacterized protein n=1 Tax=Amphiura filiformis TaxID=82378 RepID=UPI003B21AE83